MTAILRTAYGCEISSNCEDIHVKRLCASFIRQIFHFHGRSTLIPLYKETDIVPLYVRRIILALGYLQFLLLPIHFAIADLKSSMKLAAADEIYCAKDLIAAASKLPSMCMVP
jgi:hypothetical protein